MIAGFYWIYALFFATRVIYTLSNNLSKGLAVACSIREQWTELLLHIHFSKLKIWFNL
jgi:hypothetical protein